jgi:hypothetical protein
MSQGTRRAGRQVRSKKKSSSNTPLIIGAGVLVAVIAVAAFFSLNRNAGADSGEYFPDQGPSLHLQTPDDPLPVPYSTNPPTSGYHWGGGVAPWGVQTRPISDTITVHNIEHGGVIIHYRQDLDQATVAQLSELARTLQRRNPCIIMEPRAANNIDSPIILTAWNYMLKLDSFDSARITKFYEARVGRGPEAVCRPL